MERSTFFEPHVQEPIPLRGLRQDARAGWGADRRCHGHAFFFFWRSPRGRSTSRRQMSSFMAWSDGVLSGVSPGEGCPHGMVDALDFNQGIDGRCEAALARCTRRRLTSRCQMSSFTTWSDDVFLRHGVERNALLMVTMCPHMKAGVWIGRCALILMNKLSTVVRNNTFYVAHTSLGARGVRKNCAQGGVSSVACFFFVDQRTVTA